MRLNPKTLSLPEHVACLVTQKIVYETGDVVPFFDILLLMLSHIRTCITWLEI